MIHDNKDEFLEILERTSGQTGFSLWLLEKDYYITILLDNAIKFNKNSGSVKVHVEEKGNQVNLSVTDTGAGIQKKDLPYIFDRFYKADTSRTKTEHDGFGLGLSIAKDIVERHKGKIYVADTSRKGTTFEIKIPKNIS